MFGRLLALIASATCSVRWSGRATDWVGGVYAVGSPCVVGVWLLFSLTMGML